MSTSTTLSCPRRMNRLRRALLSLAAVASLAGCDFQAVRALVKTFTLHTSAPATLIAGSFVDVEVRLVCDLPKRAPVFFLWVDDSRLAIPEPIVEDGVVVPAVALNGLVQFVMYCSSAREESSMIRFFAADDAALGRRTLKLRASTFENTEYAEVLIDVVAPTGTEFSLTAPPQANLLTGAASVEVPVAVTRGGYGGPITLTWQPLGLLGGTQPDPVLGGIRTGDSMAAGANTGTVSVGGTGIPEAMTAGTLTTVLLRARGGTTSRAVLVQLLTSASAPGTPTGFAATPDVTYIRLGWNSAPTVLTYALERQNGGTWDLVSGTIPGNATSFFDNGRTPGTPYSYRLSATNVNGTSPFATLATRTLPVPLPPPPAGQGWVQLGAAASAGSVVEPQPSLLIDHQGRPVVAYREGVGSDPQRLYVKRFEGGVWTQLGTTSVNNSPNDAQQPSLAIDGTGTLYVAWQQNEPVLTNRIYVSRFNGSAWESVVPGGLPVDVAGAPSAQPSLGIGTGDIPVVAWRQGSTVQVRTLSGGQWVPSAGTGSVSAPGAYDLHVTADGAAIAWAAGLAPSSAVKVVRGFDFGALGAAATPSPLGANVSGFGALVFLGVPYVVYAEGVSPFSIRSRRWDGTAWVDYGLPITNTNENTLVSMAMDSKELAVAFSFSCVGAGCSALGVYSATPNGWVALTPFLSLVESLVSRGLSVAMATNTSPVVAAGVQVGTTYELRVRQYIP